MNPNKAIIDHVNVLKIVHPNLSQLTFKELQNIFTLVTTNVDTSSAKETFIWLTKTSKENSNLIILNYFIAIIKFKFEPTDQSLADQKLNKFFIALEKANNNKVIGKVCEWLEPQITSVVVLEYLVKSLLQEQQFDQISGSKYHSLLKVLIRLHNQKIDDNKITEQIVDLLSKKNDVRSLFYYRILLEQNFKLKVESEITRVWKKMLLSNVAQIFTKEHNEFNWLLSILSTIISGINVNTRLTIFNDFFKFTSLFSNQEVLSGFKLALENQIFIPNQFEILLKQWHKAHKENNHLRLFLKLSGIKKTINSKSEQKVNCLKLLSEIEKFERLIAFDIDKIVEHRNFGIGIVRKIVVPDKLENESNIFLKIDFTTKPYHSMSLRMASSSLEPCYPFHMKALKHFFPEKFEDLCKNSTEDFIFNVLMSIKKTVSSKELKDFLVPELISEELWKVKKKEIKDNVHKMEKVTYSSNLFSITNNHVNLELPYLESVKTESFFYSEQVDDIAKILIQTEEAITKLNTDNSESLIKSVNQIIDNFKNYKYKKDNELYYFVVLSFAYRLKIDITENIQHGISITRDLLDVELFDQLNKGFALFHSNSSRNAFIHILDIVFPEENFKAICIDILVKATEHHDLIIENLLNKKGEKFVSKIFDQINKEYHTASDAFIALLKIFFDKKSDFLKEKKNHIFNKMIKLLKQYHLNINFNKRKMINKKNFSILSHLLFDDGHLFIYLQNSNEITVTEKTEILKQLEELTFLDNIVKRKIRELHTTLSN